MAIERLKPSGSKKIKEIPEPTVEELERDTPRLLREFARKHGEKYPRLLAALRATEEKQEDDE